MTIILSWIDALPDVNRSLPQKVLERTNHSWANGEFSVLLLEKVPEDVLKILGPNEQVQAYLKQKIYHPKINVDSVVLTNERIILRHPHALGLRQDYTDYSYSDVANAILDKGMMRSTVKCVLRFGGDPLTLNDLPNDEAARAYGIIRENLVRYQMPWTAGYPGMMQMPFQPQSGARTNGPACPKCGQASRPGSRFCGSCGYSFSPNPVKS